MKKCFFCKNGILERKIIKETYTYKGRYTEVDQSGEWCESCGEGILSSADLMATEKQVRDFQAKTEKLITSDDITVSPKMRLITA